MLEKLPESIGHALIHQRAGIEQVVYNRLHAQREVARLELYSTAFAFNARLPERFTADGAGLSPPLSWAQIPAETHALALIVEDADSPTPHPLVHAIVVGLEPILTKLEEGALNSPDHQGIGLQTGQNSFLQHAWLPPDPPRGHGEHRYVFQLYALAAGEPEIAAPGRGAFVDMVLERALAVGCIIGTYAREERVSTVDDTVAANAASQGRLEFA